MNALMLKGRIIAKGFTQADIARKLGISKTAFNNKLNGKSEFTASEIKTLVTVLDIDDVAAYFFCQAS